MRKLLTIAESFDPRTLGDKTLGGLTEPTAPQPPNLRIFWRRLPRGAASTETSIGSNEPVGDNARQGLGEKADTAQIRILPRFGRDRQIAAQKKTAPARGTTLRPFVRYCVGRQGSTRKITRQPGNCSGPIEPWHGLCRQIATGGLRCPDLGQRHQALFSLVALCV